MSFRGRGHIASVRAETATTCMGRGCFLPKGFFSDYAGIDTGALSAFAKRLIPISMVSTSMHEKLRRRVLVDLALM